MRGRREGGGKFSQPVRIDPAIIEQLDSTLVLDPGSHAEVDELGNIVVTVGSRESTA